MLIECICRATIAASPAQCFAALSDTKGWTHWVRDLDRIEILDPGEATRPARVRAAATLGGSEQHVLLDVVSDPIANALALRLVEGPGLESVDGTLGFAPNPAGALMAADIGIRLTRSRTPRIGRMLSRRIETVLTRDFVRHVERAQRAL